MRYIRKETAPPVTIRDWLVAQLPVGLNLDYSSFNDKAGLRKELIAEQFGLCAYTGPPIDERLVGYNDTNLVFQAHIEHIKAQTVCRAELVAEGKRPGRDLGEDVDHRNLVAALEVRRRPPAPSEIFGAAAHRDHPLPVTPTQPNCGARFDFDDQGSIHGLDAQAHETIALLRLNHPTLVGWHRGAIAGFFPPGLDLTREEVELLVRRLEEPVAGKLPGFGFCFRSYASSLLA